MLKRGLLLFLTFILLSLGARAQQHREFNEDPKVFINEIKEFFNQDNRPETKAIIEQFTQYWQTSAFTTDEQNKIMELSNTMLRQRLKLNPDFTSYYALLNGYKRNKLPSDKFDKYHEVADQLLVKSKKDFKDFTETCEALFSNLVLYQNNAKTWKVSNDDYTFEYTKEAVITFRAVELMLFTKEDTLGVYQTSGKYYANSNKWEGKGGLVYWTRVGFGKDKAYAKLNKYRINLQSSDYKADSVEFSFPKVFAKPILGHLEDRATTTFQGDRASYPRFRSYQNVFSLKNIFNSIDYVGGFSLEGQQILGTGADSARAMVIVRQGNKVVMRALSKSFVIDPDKIAANKAAVSFYLDKDSVYHTQVYFSYLDKKRTLTLSCDNIGLYASPFFNSYHQLEFKPGNLIWNVDSSKVYLRNIANPGQAMPFESSNFYTETKYLEQQTILDYNPLTKLKHLSDVNKTRLLTEDDLAAGFGNKIEFLRQMLLQMANQGFIYYDIAGHQVVIKDKLIHYVSAFDKHADFDIITFQSTISGIPNAYFDLKNYDMKIQGVPRINVSDSQYTYFLPKDQEITFKRKLDMAFAGTVHSGRFDFFGKNFAFDYNNFKVVLSNLDSVKFKFPEYDSITHKQIGLRTVQNTIQNVNGFLYIDAPDNKSGLKPLEKYPIFECNRESFVYYEKPQIFNKVYKKEHFFFKIDPFIINNLDKFTIEGLQFPGTFTSADILPVIKNALTIQEDFSLGFKTTAPATGYQLYKGKGTAKGLFKLSNRGLRADGEIAYLVSKTASKDFVFFPDSMNTNCKTFDIPEIADGKYPPMSGKGTYNHWVPYRDSMYVYKVKDPINVYNGKIDFSGSFILTPVELVASGNVAYQNLNISAKAFAFLPKNIRTKNGDLTVKSDVGNRTALSAENINADVDLTKDFGKFQTNSDTSKVFMPSNKFATTLNTFTYDFKKKQVDFVKSGNQSDEDAYFVSNNPEQDNLKFKSKKATYDIATQKIKAEEVPFMLIADSKIFTPKNEVLIEKEGNIGSLQGADIVTDADKENHKIYNASVNIFSQNKFTGYGDYDYLDKNNKKFRVHLSDIRVNEQGNTIAKGEISDTAKFYIAPGLKYSGNIGLLSVRKELEFNGYVLADHRNKQLRTEGVKISEIVDPKEVVLTVNEPKGKDGKELYTGTFMSSDSSKLYNVFFGKKKNANDQAIFTTTGSLIYDDKAGEYVYGPKGKVAPTPDGMERDGNLFKFTPSKKLIYTEGIYDLGMKYKHIGLSTAGNYTYKYNDSATNVFDLVMLVNFPIGDETAKMLTDTLAANTKDEEEVDNTSDNVLMAYSMLTKNKKDREKVVNDIFSNHVVPSNDDFDKTIVLSSVKLRYVDSTQSFISFGKLGLSNFKRTVVNKQMNGVVELKKDKPADRISLLFVPSEGSFNYFDYQDGDMHYQASDLTYTDKTAQTASKVEKGNKGYRLKLASMREVGALYSKNRDK